MNRMSNQMNSSVQPKNHPRSRNPFIGHRLRRMPIDPPQFNEAPMYPLTIEIRKPFEEATGYNLTPAIIAQRVRAQFGGVTGGDMIMRVKSVQIYAIADSSSIAPEINADVSNLAPQLDDNVSSTAPVGVFYGLACRLRDVGTLNRPAKVGWAWSTQDKHRIMSEKSDFELVNWAVAGAATSILRCNIDFGYAGVAAPQGP